MARLFSITLTSARSLEFTSVQIWWEFGLQTQQFQHTHICYYFQICCCFFYYGNFKCPSTTTFEHQYLIQQPFCTSNHEIQAQQPSAAVTPATETSLFSRIPTCNKKFNTYTPQSPNVATVTSIAAVNLRADPQRAGFLLKAVMCNSVVFNQKEQPSTLSLCEAGNTEEPCVVVSEICFCTKWEFISGVRSYSNCLGPRATGRGRQGGGTWSRAVSRTRCPVCGQAGGREGFTHLPLP